VAAAKEGRRRSGPQPATHEIAYAALAKAPERGLVERGEIKEFYNRVSGSCPLHWKPLRLRAARADTEEFLVEMGEALLEPSWKTLRTGSWPLRPGQVAEHQPSTQDIQQTSIPAQDFIEATRSAPKVESQLNHRGTETQRKKRVN